MKKLRCMTQLWLMIAESESRIEEIRRLAHLVAMTLTLMLAAAIAAVALTERSAEHLLFAVAALLLNAALLLVFVADFERAVLLSAMLAVATAGISIVKFNHSALKLTVPDLPLVFAGTVPYFVSQYPRVMLGVLIGGVSLALASIAVKKNTAGPPEPVAFR